MPTEEAIKAVAELSPLVDVGAGTGYWSRLLADAGADVVAYDLHPPPHDDNVWHPTDRTWFHVEPLGAADAARRHPDRTLILCWPPYSMPMAFDAAVAHLAVGGTRLVYIGEGPGGCTADDQFHDLISGYCHQCSWGEPVDDIIAGPLHTCTDDPKQPYVETKVVALPQWPSLHDYLTIYERKRTDGRQAHA